MARAALIEEGVAGRERKTFIYVSNRLEGNALATIEAMPASMWRTRFLSSKSMFQASRLPAKERSVSAEASWGSKDDLGE